MHTPKETNYEIKIKKQTFSPVWNIDVKESRFFFRCRAKNFNLSQFHEPVLFKTKKQLNSYSVCTCIAVNLKFVCQGDELNDSDSR